MYSLLRNVGEFVLIVCVWGTCNKEEEEQIIWVLGWNYLLSKGVDSYWYLTWEVLIP